MNVARLCVTAGVLCAGWLQAQETQLQLELMNSISTSTCRKGDMVSARVLSPANLAGDVVEGRLAECQSGAKMGGKSVLAIAFETLRHNGAAIPISSEIRSATNSKGQVNVGEEGRMVKYGGGNVAKAGTATGVGALIGRAAGGGRGAAIGAAAGAVTSIALIQMAADAPNVSFNAGSRFVIAAKARSGPALATLQGAQPSGATPVQAMIATAPPTVQAAPAPRQPVAAAPAQPASQGAAGTQPNFVAVKVDFVPGDNVVFFDDFTDMAADAPPPHWKVRGGTAELQTGDGFRQIAMNARWVTLTPNLTALPKNFTMEVDMLFNGHGTGVAWKFRDKAGKDVMFMRLAANYTKLTITDRVGSETIASDQIAMDFSKPIKQALWVQNGRMRLYINGSRIFDVNQVNLPELGPPEVQTFTEQSAGQTQKYVAFQFARFAESLPDFSQVIMSSGRYVTRGILFDTDSDRIKPESAPVIKAIARGLETNPALKLTIEGHTDSVGAAPHNLDLSKRRAEAVKTVLVAQFNVGADRLSTAGLGATKPLESNDTPQGRAQNRRVELVRQ